MVPRREWTPALTVDHYGQGFEDAPCQRRSVSGDTGTASSGSLAGLHSSSKARLM